MSGAHQPVVVPELLTWVQLDIHSSGSTRESHLGLSFQPYRYPVDYAVCQLSVQTTEMSDLLVRDIQRDVDEGDFSGLVVKGRDGNPVVFVDVVWRDEVVGDDVRQYGRFRHENFSRVISSGRETEL